MSAPKAPTLEDLYVEAKDDLARGGTGIALKWAFKHAKAAGRVAEVERRVRQSEGLETYYRLRADYQAPGEPVPSQEAHAMVIQSMRANDMELGDAVAVAKACELVMQMARTARPQAADKPPLRAVPGGRR